MRHLRGGFSLVEVMVTVGVLGIVFVGLLRLFIFCSALSDLSGNMTLAIEETHEN